MRHPLLMFSTVDFYKSVDPKTDRAGSSSNSGSTRRQWLQRCHSWLDGGKSRLPSVSVQPLASAEVANRFKASKREKKTQLKEGTVNCYQSFEVFL